MRNQPPRSRHLSCPPCCQLTVRPTKQEPENLPSASVPMDKVYRSCKTLLFKREKVQFCCIESKEDDINVPTARYAEPRCLPPGPLVRPADNTTHYFRWPRSAWIDNGILLKMRTILLYLYIQPSITRPTSANILRVMSISLNFSSGPVRLPSNADCTLWTVLNFASLLKCLRLCPNGRILIFVTSPQQRRAFVAYNDTRFAYDDQQARTAARITHQ